MLQYIWSCSDKSFSSLDERTEEFTYYEIYNEKTNQIEKRKKLIDKKTKCTMTVASYFFLFIVLASMIIYQVLMKDLKGTYSEDGYTLLVPPTM
jgi:hypothetical protein